jgi:hypothetical protein
LLKAIDHAKNITESLLKENRIPRDVVKFQDLQPVPPSSVRVFRSREGRSPGDDVVKESLPGEGKDDVCPRIVDLSIRLKDISQSQVTESVPSNSKTMIRDSVTGGDKFTTIVKGEAAQM